MRYRVEIGAHVMEQLASGYAPERSAVGNPDQYDFVGGPLAAAIDRFKAFDELPEVVGPAVRLATIVDPLFGAVTFTGVLIAAGLVEIAEFVADPDYWSFLDADPEE